MIPSATISLRRLYVGNPTVLIKGQRSLTTIVARSRFRPARTITKSKKAAAESEGSWPRSVVIGFFATVTIVVPYTASWYLAQHIETREIISNVLNLDDTTWDPIRRRFGERDYAGDADTYKFEDEPDCTVRQAHFQAVRRNEGVVTVKVAHLTDDEPYCISREETSVMPASTLARAENFSTYASVALEFPDDEGETKQQDGSTIDSEFGDTSLPRPEPIPYQVYSAWYYHPDEEQTSSPQISSRTIVASELAAIEAELVQLDQEVKQGRAMDDPYVQERVRLLKAERRRLQWSRWFGK